MKKNSFWLAALVCSVSLTAFTFALSGCSTQDNQSSGLIITASFYPIYDFASVVAGADPRSGSAPGIRVINVMPPGAEPHEYEPTPRDVAGFYQSRLFIYNGAGLDPWAEKVAPDLQKKGIKTLNISDFVDRIGNDPHFWLDPVNAEKEVLAIAKALAEVDPVNSSRYLKNAENYILKLKKLDQDYQDALKGCQNKEFATSHTAFAYLAGRYGLEQIPIAGISPDQEPTAKALAGIINLARQKNLKTIYFETLVSPKLAETVASEIGANTEVLYTIEGLSRSEIEAGEDYISHMYDNLHNLLPGFQCSGSQPPKK